MWADIKVLLIEDCPERLQILQAILQFIGNEVVCADSQSWQQALARADVTNSSVLTVLLGDCQQVESSDVMQALYQWDRHLPILCLSSAAFEAAADSAALVFTDVDYPPSYHQLLDHLHRCQVYREQIMYLGSKIQTQELGLLRSLVGDSAVIKKVRKLVLQVADKDVSVMIQGESGTGKEVVARGLHYHSNRKNGPFVPINCGAIPAELLESELFGHEKGAFTGAINSRPGRFELAEGGTLFLDEIGDMPLNMQVKILRVLQEHTFERVGSNKTVKANVRIIAATHKNLEEMIKLGSFREDLYYRLNVFPIDVPALRERLEDLPLLITELVARLERERRGSVRFNARALHSLAQHSWPGNVRELANLVERMAILYPHGVVGVEELPEAVRYFDNDRQPSLLPLDLPLQVSTAAVMNKLEQPVLLPEQGLDLRKYLQELECSLIRQALDDSRGVVAHAAERLSVRRTTLVEKMRKYNLNKKEVVN